MSAPIYRVYVEHHEWQCEPMNEAAREYAEEGEYPDGPMLPLAENTIDAGHFPITKEQARALLGMADAAGPAWTPKALVEALQTFVGEP